MHTWALIKTAHNQPRWAFVVQTSVGLVYFFGTSSPKQSYEVPVLLLIASLQPLKWPKGYHDLVLECDGGVVFYGQCFAEGIQMFVEIIGWEFTCKTFLYLAGNQLTSK